MIKQLFRQTIELLRQNPLMSFISILGSAFAICLIMVLVISWQVKYKAAVPETNLERSMFIRSLTSLKKGKEGWRNSWYASPVLMKDLVLPSKYVETATAATPTQIGVLSTTDESARVSLDYRSTDPEFWKIYEFRFLDGRPFTEADRKEEGSEVVVITASVARKLFGTEKAAGNNVMLNRFPMRVVGVVEDVSLTAVHSYAQMWAMYGSKLLRAPVSADDYRNNYEITILAHSSDDFSLLHSDIHNRLAQMNSSFAEWELEIYSQPDDPMTARNRVFPDPDMKGMYWQYAIALFIILLVPALNLCGLSSSRMQQRMSELGVRKAYGSTRFVLIRRILNENMLLTLLGGIVGFITSYGVVYLLREWIFSTFWSDYANGEVVMPATSLFSPMVFVCAFVFCLLMNLLSAGIPAWYASGKPIVVSLNDK
jgi:putative ABC transport system permease protein